MTDTNNPFEGEQKMTSSNLEETLNSLTSYIRQLQGVDESMYKVLRNNPNITDLEKEEAVSQINDLSAKREALNHEINSLGERAKVDLKVDCRLFLSVQDGFFSALVSSWENNIRENPSCSQNSFYRMYFIKDL